VATGAAWLKGRNSQGERENKNILTGKKKRKTYLTLTGLLMEGARLSMLALDFVRDSLASGGLVSGFSRFTSCPKV
jgi:hypothetical protein